MQEIPQAISTTKNMEMEMAARAALMGHRARRRRALGEVTPLSNTPQLKLQASMAHPTPTNSHLLTDRMSRIVGAAPTTILAQDRQGVVSATISRIRAGHRQ